MCMSGRAKAHRLRLFLFCMIKSFGLITSLANTEMSRIVPTSTKSLYSPMMNYNDLGTGKEKGTAQRNSKTGTTRAKSSLGIR